MNYQEKIEQANKQIKRLQDEVGNLTGMAKQIAETENGREIAALNKNIADWSRLISETPEEAAARKAEAEKEAERLEFLNQNFSRLEKNNWDY